MLPNPCRALASPGKPGIETPVPGTRSERLPVRELVELDAVYPTVDLLCAANINRLPQAPGFSLDADHAARALLFLPLQCVDPADQIPALPYRSDRFYPQPAQPGNVTNRGLASLDRAYAFRGAGKNQVAWL